MSNEVLFSYLNENSEIMDIFMRNVKKYGPALSLAQEVLREDSFLSSKDREIIAAYTSKLNNCQYCNTSHEAFAQSLGATEEDYERLSPLFRYVEKLTLSPSSLTKEDYNSVIESGFSEDELGDAVAVCAAFNFYNRIVEGHGIQPHDDYSADIEMINTRGYDQRY